MKLFENVNIDKNYICDYLKISVNDLNDYIDEIMSYIKNNPEKESINLIEKFKEMSNDPKFSKIINMIALIDFCEKINMYNDLFCNKKNITKH